MHGLLLSLESLLSWETLSKIASVFSIASFGLTLWVLLETRKLKALYKLRGRGPSLIKDLVKMASSLSKYLNDYSNSTAQIAQELGKIEVKLKSLEPKLSGAPKGSVKTRNLSVRYNGNFGGGSSPYTLIGSFSQGKNHNSCGLILTKLR